VKDIKKFIENLKKYYKYSLRSAKAELKSEVSDSYLNWLWWIIEPLCFMLIYTFVFGVIFQNKTPYFASFIFIGLTAWEFFNRMINGSVKLIVTNRNLISKVYIPKYILLISKSFSYLFKFFISLCLTLILMFFMKVPFTLNIFYVIPIFMVLYILTLGISLNLMHLGVYLDDLANLTRIVLRVIFYLSGVFYNLKTRLSGSLGTILLKANPIAFIMNEFRNTVLYGQSPSFLGLLVWLSIGILLCFLGIRTIHKNENNYVKVI